MDKGFRTWLEKNSVAVTTVSGIAVLVSLLYGPAQGFIEGLQTDVRITYLVTEPTVPPNVVELSRSLGEILEASSESTLKDTKSNSTTNQDFRQNLSKLRSSYTGRMLVNHFTLEVISRIDVKVENLQNKNLSNSRLKVEGVSTIWDLEIVDNSFTQREIDALRTRILKPYVDAEPRTRDLAMQRALRNVQSQLGTYSADSTVLVDLPSLSPGQQIIFKLYGDAGRVQTSLLVNEPVKMEVKEGSIDSKPDVLGEFRSSLYTSAAVILFGALLGYAMMFFWDRAKRNTPSNPDQDTAQPKPQ